MLVRCIVIGNSNLTKHFLTALVSSFGYLTLAILQTSDSYESDYVNLATSCAENNVEHKVYDSLSTGNSVYSAIKYVENLAPDIILLIGFNSRIHDAFLKIAPCIATYEGVLPEYCGHDPISYTILDQIPESGLTLYKVSSYHPYGNIVLQNKIDVLETDDAASLYDKICDLSETVLEDLRLELSLGLPNQKLFLDSEIKTFWSMLVDDDYIITWNRPCEDIIRQIKALTFPFRGAYFLMDNQIVTVFKAIPGVFKTNKVPGSLVYQDEMHYVVTTATTDIDILDYVMQ